MYINFNKLLGSGIDVSHLILLIAIKQKEKDDIVGLYYDEEVIDDWLSIGWIKRLKKGDLRIDTKGELFLKSLSGGGDISESTEKIIEWLIKIYKSKEEGIVKNKRETLRRCQWFSEQTGFFENKLAILLKSFVEDTYSHSSGMSKEEFKKVNPRMVLSNMIDCVFWKPPNNFARHYTLDDSPLWRYYEDNIDYINKLWIKHKVE